MLWRKVVHGLTPLSYIVGLVKNTGSTILNKKNKNIKGKVKLKEISKSDVRKLEKAKIIRNTHDGFVNKSGSHVGTYVTCGGTVYIEDYYAELARKK